MYVCIHTYVQTYIHTCMYTFIYTSLQYGLETGYPQVAAIVIRFEFPAHQS